MALHLPEPRSALRERVVDILGRVGIPSARMRAEDYPHQFSGGMAQRVMIGMGISCVPSLLIADEPSTALDVTTQKEILKLIEELQADLSGGHRCAVLFITHDMGVVAEIADEVLVMHQGKAVEYGTRDAVLQTPQADYTKMLLAAVPSMTPPPARPAPQGPPLLRGQEVSKSYSARDWLGRSRLTHALQAASVAVHAGETVGIVGESGSGKSVTALSIMRLIPHPPGLISGGEIIFNSKKNQCVDLLRLPEGEMRKYRGNEISMIF
jgi:peptide/nickel transport system ATP-binding protein